MADPLIEEGAEVVCPHDGPATPTRPSMRVTIGGMPATMAGEPFAIACPAKPPITPCTVGIWTGTPRVLIEGQPAILATSLGECPPNGDLIVLATQVRVRGGS